MESLKGKQVLQFDVLSIAESRWFYVCKTSAYRPQDMYNSMPKQTRLVQEERTLWAAQEGAQIGCRIFLSKGFLLDRCSTVTSKFYFHDLWILVIALSEKLAMNGQSFLLAQGSLKKDEGKLKQTF